MGLSCKKHFANGIFDKRAILLEFGMLEWRVPPLTSMPSKPEKKFIGGPGRHVRRLVIAMIICRCVVEIVAE